MTTTMLPLNSQLTKKQIEILEAEFVINTRPDITTRDRLANTLKISNLLIYVWFQVRRSRLRRNPSQRRVSQKSKVDTTHQPSQLSVVIDDADVTKSSSDVADQPLDLSTASRKRKSQDDINDKEMPPHPCKKPATNLPLMTSPTHHPAVCGANQYSSSVDTTSGVGISPLMSVDFLSRSSQTERMPCHDVTHLYRTPMFYPCAVPYLIYYH
ncbi:paired box protein Pax-6-like [Lytechinus variegatus]|uniref:paired box protein Pax-6-like n=1 Tax=Lytechinus variegatus TaxID=7654 RepID=UPI001BB1261C|nr:paired box protein Pax-6-like [Lytechinus variegatus]